MTTLQTRSFPVKGDKIIQSCSIQHGANIYYVLRLSFEAEVWSRYLQPQNRNNSVCKSGSWFLPRSGKAYVGVDWKPFSAIHLRRSPKTNIYQYISSALEIVLGNLPRVCGVGWNDGLRHLLCLIIPSWLFNQGSNIIPAWLPHHHLLYACHLIYLVTYWSCTVEAESPA